MLAADIQVRDDQGRFVTVPLHEASTGQIEDATALLRERRVAARRPASRYIEAAARVADRLPPVKGVSKKQRVKVKKGEDGEVLVSFRDVAVSDVEEFVKVVLDELRG